ncbi:MAG TPA: 23S rRNA (uracil-5-)-methyltransferase RumA, partial [Acidobacteriota bacterium]|nr:23S rRNA (uracil-5-)-methyltransferase RumA [Acidobacteriota bacterium]
INLRPQRLVYVSCDPSTLARDVRRLSTAGFVIETITGIDFFPQTYHIETVVQMRWEGFN